MTIQVLSTRVDSRAIPNVDFADYGSMEMTNFTLIAEISTRNAIFVIVGAREDNNNIIRIMMS